jgi:hypothetical protein
MDSTASFVGVAEPTVLDAWLLLVHVHVHVVVVVLVLALL